jgi:hypothetical protein
MDPPFLCFLAVVFLILFFFWTCFFYFFLQQATTQETEGGAHRGTGARPTAGSRGVLCPSGPIRVCFFFFAFFTLPFFWIPCPFLPNCKAQKEGAPQKGSHHARCLVGLRAEKKAQEKKKVRGGRRQQEKERRR